MAQWLRSSTEAQAQLPAPTLVGLQLPIAPAPGDLTPSSGLCRQPLPANTVCTHTATDMNMFLKIN